MRETKKRKRKKKKEKKKSRNNWLKAAQEYDASWTVVALIHPRKKNCSCIRQFDTLKS